MKIGIATDSTCDIPAWLVEQHEIEVIPSVLVMDGVEYIDGRDISRDEFYRLLPGLRNSPTTAASSTGEFSAAYEALLRRGCERILSIHAPEVLTTILNTARQAAESFPGRVTCIDSGSLSLGLGFQVLAAAEAAELGWEAALAAVESTRRRLRVSAALDSMEYVKRSGRVPAAVAALGGLLSIRPLIELSEGQVKAIGAVRTRGQADERMLNFLLEGGPLERLAILHTSAEARARGFLNLVMQRASQSVPREILMVNVTSVIGTHVGPNGLGFASITVK
jgi:DegV family protein with EDD domain